VYLVDSSPTLKLLYLAYSLEVTFQKVLKKLAYYTLLGGHSEKKVPKSKFCADSESTNSRILSLPKPKLLQENKTASWMGDKKKFGLCKIVSNFTKLS